MGADKIGGNESNRGVVEQFRPPQESYDWPSDDFRRQFSGFAADEDSCRLRKDEDWSKQPEQRPNESREIDFQHLSISHWKGAKELKLAFSASGRNKCDFPIPAPTGGKS